MGQQTLPDGNLSFRGGQNAGILPDRIREDQYASGVNVTTEDGGLGPRPGFVFQDIVVVTEGGIEDPVGKLVPYTEIFRSGKFQGAAEYIAESFEGLIAVISGVIFIIDVERLTAEVLDVEDQDSDFSPLQDLIEPESQRINQYTRRVSIEAAGRFTVIHDYPDTPILIEGGEARRSDPKAEDVDGNPVPELIPSVLGSYNQSRYFFTSIVNEFTAGDPVGSLTAPDAPITIQEISIPAAPFLGQVFSLGSTNQNKPITAMGFLQVTDNSTGVGPLFIATRDSIYTYRTDLPRSQWEQTQFGRKILFNAGIAGPRAFTNNNTDLYFVSGDGKIRSLVISAGEQQKFANTSIDREIENWTVADDPDLLSLSAVATAGNRVYFTVDPYRVDAQDLSRCKVTDYAFGGLVVLELDNVSGLLTDAVPVWAGLWTGINPMDLVELNGDLYIFSKDPGAVNALYKVDEELSYDVYQDEIRPITSRVYLKEYAHQDRFQLKEEKFIEPTFSNLRGKIKVVIDRKTEAAPNWIPWRTWNHNAVVNECGNIDCETVRPVLIEQSFRDINFGSPANQGQCDPVTREDLRYFKRSQYRLTITGENWKLQSFRAVAKEADDAERIHSVCDDLERRVEKDCSDISDWLIHSTPFNGAEACL